MSNSQQQWIHCVSKLDKDCYNARVTWLTTKTTIIITLIWNVLKYWECAASSPTSVVRSAKNIYNWDQVMNFCTNQLFCSAVVPKHLHDKLHSPRLVCVRLWPYIPYKECGCSKIPSHSNLSLVFLRCFQLCPKRWKNTSITPANKFEVSFWKSAMNAADT